MFDNIKHGNIHKDTSHIVINTPVPTKEYDNLYEQWNDPKHTIWTSFLKKQNIEVKLQNYLKATAHRNKKEYVGYWFFRQRTDKRAIHINFSNTNVKYYYNVLFICDSEQQFSVKKQEIDLPEMLTCIVYFNDQRRLKELLD